LATEGLGKFTPDQLDTLDKFADRNRDASQRAELIAGIPQMLERGIIYLVLAALLIVFPILYFAKVNMVVEAKGKILPEGDVISLQPGQGGMLVRLLAHAGDRLMAGAPLAAIDVSEAGLNLAQVTNKLALDEAQVVLLQKSVARLTAVVADPRLVLGGAAGDAILGAAYQGLNTLQNAQLKLDAAQQEEHVLPDRMREAQQEYDLNQQRLSMLQKNRTEDQTSLDLDTEALARKKEQLASVRRLAENKLLSQLEVNTEEERYRNAENGVASARQRVAQLDVDIANARLQLSGLRTKMRDRENEAHVNSRALQVQYEQALASVRQERDNEQIQLHGLQLEIEQSRARIVVQERQMNLATIRMPVTGTIADLKLHNVGELVSAGASVATVVPDGVPLIVEANLDNKDIGFVHPGTEARVKVDAFPYQQFGTARARVTRVLPAVGGNAQFVVVLALLDRQLASGGTVANLIPGLSVQAGLITQQQRIIQTVLKSDGAGGK
jgi:HlyD family secretion protein